MCYGEIQDDKIVNQLIQKSGGTAETLAEQFQKVF